MRQTVHNESVGQTAPARDADKAFADLRARLALAGHTLHRTHPADGPQAFYVERWGMVRHLPTLEHVRAFLKQIGGAQ